VDPSVLLEVSPYKITTWDWRKKKS